jgi:hypothetical protein
LSPGRLRPSIASCAHSGTNRCLGSRACRSHTTLHRRDHGCEHPRPPAWTKPTPPPRRSSTSLLRRARPSAGIGAYGAAISGSATRAALDSRGSFIDAVAERGRPRACRVRLAAPIDQFFGGEAIRQSACSALAVDCDSKGGTDLFHPQVTETAEPFDQNTGRHALDRAPARLHSGGRGWSWCTVRSACVEVAGSLRLGRGPPQAADRCRGVRTTRLRHEQVLGSRCSSRVTERREVSPLICFVEGVVVVGGVRRVDLCRPAGPNECGEGRVEQR